jgi:hypothetical protein
MEERIKIETGNIVNSAGVLNFESQLMNVNTSIENIRSSSADGKSKELANLCERLKISLESIENLSPDEKSDVLEQIDKILKAAQDPNNKNLLDRGKRALGALKGILNVMPVVGDFKEIIEGIGKFFGL